MLEVINLGCERHQRMLFHELSFRVAAGEWVQITGGNGAGKTTLLRHLTGLLQPESGEVRWGGKPLPQVRDEYHQQLLWTGHQPGIKTRLSALQNLRFFAPHASVDACFEALAQAGLVGLEALPVARLSAGQQRRVALARLWLTQARLWILDEPFAALDTSGITRLTQRMASHVAQGGLVVMTSHQPLDVAAGRLRQIALNGGECG